jgi:uncharacterized delta-60 repeat protein
MRITNLFAGSRLGVFAGLLVLAMAGPVHSAAGDPDTSFDSDAFNLTNIENTTNDGQAWAMAMQSDGKMVLAGYAWAKTRDFALLRYNANGSLDTSFGIGGKVVTPVGTDDDFARAVAIQPDGKIVVAGYAKVGGFERFAVVRYETDGSLDTTFDGDGKVTTTLGAGNATGFAVAIQADGAIVVAGRAYNGSNYDVGVARYLDTGALDTSFSGDGIVMTSIGTSHDFATSVLLQGTKIVATGKAFMATDDLLAVRYLSDGTLDTTFDGDGKITVDLGSAAHDLPGQGVLQTNGRILISGSVLVGGDYDFGVVRIGVNGGLDTTFSVDGIQVSDFNVLNNYANAISIRPTGEIVVAGYTDNAGVLDVTVARYDPADGSLDTAFSSDGWVRTTVGTGSAIAYGVACQDDGKMVAAGYADAASGYDFAAVRYNAGGSLDTTFSSDGKATTPVAPNRDYGKAVAIQADGKSVVAGYTQDFEVYTAALARYDVDGSLDTTFGTGGRVVIQLGTGGSILHAVAIDSSQRIVVAGEAWNGSNWDFVLARFLSTGEADDSFSGDGKILDAIGASHDGAYGIAIQADGRIVAAGYSYNGTNYDFAVVRHLTTGAADSSFSGNGEATNAVLAENDVAYAVAIQSDGKIVLAGNAYNGVDTDFALARYLSTGVLDAAGFSGGTVTTSMGFGNDDAYAVAVDSSGNIVAAGKSYGGASTDFAVARYLPSGALDTTFSLDGWLRTDLLGGNIYTDTAFGVKIQTDGKIVAGGYTAGVESSDFAVVRYNDADGSLDTSFSGDGIATLTLGGQDIPTAMALQVNSRIVLAGYSNQGINGQDFGIARFLVEGTCGNTIGELGETCDDGNLIDGDCCSSDCQYDVAGTACGDPTDTVCDNPDICDGAGACTPNFQSAATTCRASGGICDVAELCTGTAADCPANSFVSASMTCRNSAGVCDQAETCTGTSAACPTNSFQPPATTCRAATGVCDNAETCTGSSATCPTNTFLAASNVCRPAGGVCDNAEMCPGNGANCPADGRKSAATSCRAAAGFCDLNENCTGTSNDCPTDLFKTTTCRAAAGVCDVAEVCDGAAPNCPVNGFASTSQACATDSNACTADFCNGSGTCAHNDITASCDDGDLCSADSCSPSTGCVNSFVPRSTASCLVAPAQQFQVKLDADPAKRKLKWKWGAGEAFAQAVLGAPETSTTYSLCIYDTTSSVADFFAGVDVVPSASWESKDPKGYKYKDKTAASNGVSKIGLKPGDAAKTKAQLGAGGANLPTMLAASPTAVFSQEPHVTVQLVNSDGMCLTSEFDVESASKNDGAQFKAKTK